MPPHMKHCFLVSFHHIDRSPTTAKTSVRTVIVSTDQLRQHIDVLQCVLMCQISPHACFQCPVDSLHDASFYVGILCSHIFDSILFEQFANCAAGEFSAFVGL